MSEGDLFAHAVALGGDLAIFSAPLDAERGEEAGAAYVFERINGFWGEQAKLHPLDGPPGLHFSLGAVAVMRSTVLVGWPADDDQGSRSGSAYVFERDPDAGWVQTAKLLASDGAEDDFFGGSVGLSGDQALVGAWNQGVGGAVYVFERRAEEWFETQKLVGGGLRGLASFGWVLSVHEDTLAVGAPWDGPLREGSAFVFERQSDGAWVEVEKLVAHDRGDSDLFGTKVGVHGSVVAVAAGNDDDMGPNAGAAYVFERSETGEWLETAKLLAEDGRESDAFGAAVAVSPDAIYVMAGRAEIGKQPETGAVYVYRKIDGVWTQTNKFAPPDAQTGDQFGIALAVDGGTLLAGAPRDDDNGVDAGSAYVYELDRCGDINEDGVIDLRDYARFHECMTGPNAPVRPSCESADLDRDTDADLHDFALLSISIQ